MFIIEPKSFVAYCSKKKLFEYGTYYIQYMYEILFNDYLINLIIIINYL